MPRVRWSTTAGPPLLPMSLQLGDLGTFARLRPEVSASVVVPPWEEGPSIGDVDSDMVVFSELGVAPLIDSGTDLEDELLMPDDSPGSVAVCSAGAALPEVCPVPRGGFDLELPKALLDVLVVLMMITPILWWTRWCLRLRTQSLPFPSCWWTFQRVFSFAGGG